MLKDTGRDIYKDDTKRSQIIRGWSIHTAINGGASSTSNNVCVK